MRKKLIAAVEDKPFETQELIVRWILTHYGRNIFHLHRNGCSINLDTLNDVVVKKIYDFVVEQPN